MKHAKTHTVDPTKAHHFINGQLVPVVESRSRSAAAGGASSRRQPAKKNKGVVVNKPSE